MKPTLTYKIGEMFPKEFKELRRLVKKAKAELAKAEATAKKVEQPGLFD